MLVLYKAQGEIRRILKSGGLFGVRALDLGTRISQLHDLLIAQYRLLFARVRERLGWEQWGLAVMGPLRQAEFTSSRVSVSFLFGRLEDPEQDQRSVESMGRTT
jgi:hypothetical protein